MKKVRMIIFIFLGLCIAVETCFAGTLKIATLNYPPFQYEENGEIKGVAASIVKEIFARMNQPIEINFYPFPRAIYNIKNGTSDIIFTFYYKKEREQFAEYSSEPLVNQTISLFIDESAPVVFNGELSSLSQYGFGLVRFSYGKIFDEAVAKKVIPKVEYTSQMETNMRKFLKRRFEILPSDRWVALYYYSQMASKDAFQIKELSPPIQTFPAYIGFAKINKLTAVKERVDDTLKKMKQDGSYQKIIDSHISQWGINLKSK